jgi:hypothetical protein
MHPTKDIQQLLQGRDSFSTVEELDACHLLLSKIWLKRATESGAAERDEEEATENGRLF